MRWAVIAGVLGAGLLPTLASAEVKVALGDGVSVVFPGAPVKMHTTMESPPGTVSAPAPPRRAPGGPPLPVPPVEHGFSDFGSADNWMFRQGGATFTATALSLRSAHRDLPARCGPAVNLGVEATCRVIGSGPTAVREDRRVFEGGALMIRRSISHGGRAYTVAYMRLAPQTLAKLKAKDQTSAASIGDSFLASLQVKALPHD